MRLGLDVNTHQAVPHMRLRLVAKHSRYRRCYSKTHLPFDGVTSLLLSRPMSVVSSDFSKRLDIAVKLEIHRRCPQLVLSTTLTFRIHAKNCVSWQLIRTSNVI